MTLANVPWTSAGDLARQALAEVELRTEFPELGGLSTGVSVIDEKLRPILEPGRLVVVAAESGRGKSAFAAQLAIAFGHQVPVLWASLEDDGVDVIRRAISNVGRTSVGALRGGYRDGSVPDSTYRAVEHIEQLPIDIIETTGCVVDLALTIRSWARSNDKVQGPLGGVVIVDQLSHLQPTSREVRAQLEHWGLPTPPRNGAPDHERLEWQVNLLREAGRMLNLLVVVLHQLNDSRSDDGKPTMASVRGSRGIVHKADALVVPWRPTKVDNPFAGPGEPKTTAAPEDAAELICLKGRSIASGWAVPLRWDGAHQRFADPGETEPKKYVAPEAPSENELEGARRLAELRARFAQQRTVAIETAMRAELMATGVDESEGDR